MPKISTAFRYKFIVRRIVYICTRKSKNTRSPSAEYMNSMRWPVLASTKHKNLALDVHERYIKILANRFELYIAARLGPLHCSTPKKFPNAE